MKREFLLSIVISLGFLTLGFVLLHYEMVGYGLSFFVFLPFILGFLLGGNTIKNLSMFGLMISFVIFGTCLLVGEMEGMVCMAMAMPLVLAAVGLGALIRYLFGGRKRSEHPDDLLKSSIVPFLLFLFLGWGEKELTKNDEFVVEVSSEITLPYTPMQVYETIKSVDTLDASKPFLMKLDLPIPQKCILEEEKVGGLRTCYFEGGLIVEQITELERAKILRMDVVDYQLTGRKWLGFREAIYTFDELENGHCLMTRITTYSSELYPRVYWEPLEKMGIEQEHEYVFRNLVKDLAQAYPD